MFPNTRSALAMIREELAAIDMEALDGPGALEMASVYAELSNVAQAGATLAAGRVEATGAWAATGCRSARSHISSTLGVGPGAAERVLELAGRLRRFSATRSAFCEGTISMAQADETSRAAARVPQAEAGLIDTARTGSFSRLRDQANATQAASAEADRERAENARRRREVRTWVDADGVGHLHARGPADRIALLMSRIQSRADGFFDHARRAGHRETPGAYRFEALMGLVEDAFGPGCETTAPTAVIPAGKRPRPRVDLLIRIDFAAIRRGYTTGAELCEIAGIGAVPVAAALDYLGEAALKFVMADGVELKAVAHCGRHINSHLRSALAWQYRTCAEPGCDRALWLENDHEHPYAKGGMTSFENLRPKCHACHAEKTRRDYPNGTATRRRRDSEPAAVP